MNKKLAYKYLKFLLVTVLFVNVLQFVFSLFDLKNKLDLGVLNNPILREWITLIGIFYCILILSDKGNFKGMSNMILLGILLMTFFSYYNGVMFLILFLMLTPIEEKRK